MIKLGWILMNAFLFLLLITLTEFGINKALSIPLQELRTPKTISNDNNLSFITFYNQNNPSVYQMIDKSVESLEPNKVDSFENLRVMKSK